MKIFLGPAGVGIGSKDRSSIGGIKYVKEIDLNCMELEFVRGVKMSREMAREVGETAKNLGIQLTVHAPYFINLLSEKRSTVEESKKRILESLDRAELMGAKAVVVHAGYYGNLNKEEAFRKMKEVTQEILDEMKKSGIKALLAYETMAKESQFAGLEELLSLKKELRSKLLTINIDFAHLFVRNNGKIDYKEVLDKVKGFRHLFTHFSNVKYNLNSKKFLDIHLPINSHPPFKPLAQEILKRKIDITIISESPVLEKDSIKMLKIFRELGAEI